jgi:hypothetical protein
MVFLYGTIYNLQFQKKLENPRFPPCPVGIERRKGINKILMQHPVGVTLPHETKKYSFLSASLLEIAEQHIGLVTTFC